MEIGIDAEKDTLQSLIRSCLLELNRLKLELTKLEVERANDNTPLRIKELEKEAETREKLIAEYIEKVEMGEHVLKRKIAMATMALIPLTATSAFAGSKQGIVTATSLNVRSGPSTNNSVLFSVKKNEKVDILDSMSGWYKISTSKGKTGWASSEYINTNIDSNSDTNENKKVVTANSLNMRSGASTSYRVITKLSKGTVVEVISESNGWSKIKFEGKEAYTSSQYLSSYEENTTPDNNNTITGGDRTEIVKGATVNYKALTYTLSEHIERQLSKGSGNQVDSTIQRVMDSSVSTFAFVNANRADVEYFINPANFVNSAKGMLQFLRLDIYKDGKIYLQSLSSMLPPIILEPQEGKDILDMAAAPGGKTTQMAALSNNKAHITACEMNNIRIEKLKYNVEKQGATCVYVMQKDSRQIDDFFSFDQILLDSRDSKDKRNYEVIKLERKQEANNEKIKGNELMKTKEYDEHRRQSPGSVGHQ